VIFREAFGVALRADPMVETTPSGLVKEDV
jgi:hypothetical protein